MIEGKLQDMGREPCNVQVIVQGEGEHAVLYLVDDNGTIRKINGGNHEVLSCDGGNELEAGVGIERPRAASEEQDATSEGQRETVSDNEIEPHNGREELERLRVVIEQQKETISSLEGQNEAIHDLEDSLSEAKLTITTLIESHEEEEGL